MASSASSNDAELGRTRPGGDTATSHGDSRPLRRSGDTATLHGDSRPLRLRVRKIEASYIAKIESGVKLFEITQQRYLGTAHGWTLGWELRTEVQEELWIGLSPVGMLAVTHFACLESCDTLDGVACWADCARLHGSGISVDQAMKRDQNPKTALDATKQTYAWRFKGGSIHKLREPAEIEAFCGPWGEASLRDLDYADTPLPMYDQMTLSLVPRRTSRKRAARQLPAVERRRDVVEHAEQQAEAKRLHPWDHGKTTLALSLNAALRSPVVVVISSDDDEDESRALALAHPRRRLLLSSDSDEETASDDDAAVESADANEQDEEWMQQSFEQEALDAAAGDETHEEYDDEPNTGDPAFINDEDTESNYDEDSCTWSEQDEFGELS